MVIFTGTRLRSFSQRDFKTDPTLHEATYIALTQAELSFSIVAATIPVARTLVTDLVTYYNAAGFGSSSGDGSRGTRSNTYQMKSLKSSSAMKSSGQRKCEIGYLGSGHHQGDNADGDADSQELVSWDESVHFAIP